jgi:hypothetical protein
VIKSAKRGGEGFPCHTSWTFDLPTSLNWFLGPLLDAYPATLPPLKLPCPPPLKLLSPGGMRTPRWTPRCHPPYAQNVTHGCQNVTPIFQGGATSERTTSFSALNIAAGRVCTEYLVCRSTESKPDAQGASSRGQPPKHYWHRNSCLTPTLSLSA